MNTPRSNEQHGEGFAFFRWACLKTVPELTFYPGSIVTHVWYLDWVWKDFRKVIYGR